jgi:hypothetical protein
MVRVMIVEDDQATRQRFSAAISGDARTTLMQALSTGRGGLRAQGVQRRGPDRARARAARLGRIAVGEGRRSRRQRSSVSGVLSSPRGDP